MARKLTPKQEKFAQLYVELGNASEAYRQAYPRSLNWKPDAVNCAGSKMMAKGKVSERVEELQARVQKRHEITVDGQVEKMETIFSEHKTNPKSAGAAVSAVKHQSELAGLIVKKHKLDGSVVLQELPPLSPKAALAIKKTLESEKF